MKFLIFTLLISLNIFAQETIKLRQITDNFYKKYKDHQYYCMNQNNYGDKTCKPLKSLEVKIAPLENSYSTLSTFEDGNLIITISDSLTTDKAIFELDQYAKRMEKYD